MKYLFVFLFTSIVAMDSAAQAQHTECGSVPTAQQIQHIAQLRQQSAGLDKRPSLTDTAYIPVMAHIITLNNGLGGLAVNSLIDEIAIVNVLYASSMVQFYLCDSVHFIADNDYYYFEKTVDEAGTADVHDRPNMLNIYFAGELFRVNSNNDTTYLCGYAYFPPGPDRIFMSNNCSTNGSTLAHEIGHYMSLYHTHETFIDDEFVDGSNCAVSGDLFCDTPADPNLNGRVNSSCVYTGTATDGNGDAYLPDPSNIMSYSRKSCRDFFSPEQIQAVTDAFVWERQYLLVKPFADFTEVQNTFDVQFTTTRANDAAFTQFWDFGDGSTSNLSNPLHVFADTGTYTICHTAENLCASYTVCKTLNIACDGLTASFTYADTLEENLTVSFNTDFSDSTMVTWNMGDGTTLNSPDVEHTYTAPGEYDVYLFVANDCGSSDTTITITVLPAVTGISALGSVDDHVKLFPVPTHDVLSIASDTEYTTWVITGIEGQVLLSGEMLSAPATPVDVSLLQAGVYFLHLVADTDRRSLKFVKAE